MDLFMVHDELSICCLMRFRDHTVFRCVFFMQKMQSTLLAQQKKEKGEGTFE
ncbi:hypothetical protein DFR59_102596 [Falsibacillus pallidus]|uniref:Uncharacterized protein n=1 Tax=Falsibacillus pallidus TaxID=493781 RepID=A0A370GRD2_9BACI|nr:hypothetical protein DFR59_102596 [Falsibacillus pallidus]